MPLRAVLMSLGFCLVTGWAQADQDAYPRVVLQDHPVGYWRFESTSEQVENLGSQETALSGKCVDVTWTEASPNDALGQAAVFDRPTSRVELATQVSCWLSTTASLEFWIRTAQCGEGSWNAPAIFGADSNGDGNDLFWGTNSGGRIGVRRGDSGPAALTHKPINDSRWHHVVLTRNHQTGVLQAYCDGRLEGTYHDSPQLSIQRSYGMLGQVEALPGHGQKFMGSLDEVAVYDYVLEPHQVKRHWEAAGRIKSHDQLPSLAALRLMPVTDWTDLAPLVKLDRDGRDAAWQVMGDVAEFSAGKPRAYISFPLPIQGSYEIQTHVTIVRAKETTALYLPVADGTAIVLDMRGDNGNTESPTATISLRGLASPLEPCSDTAIKVGSEFALYCRVIVSGTNVDVEVRRDDQELFHWRGEMSQVTGSHVLRPGTPELETAYYTVSRFRKLQLRMLQHNLANGATSSDTNAASAEIQQ